MANEKIKPEEFREFFAELAAAQAAAGEAQGVPEEGRREAGLVRAALACIGSSGAHDFPTPEDLLHQSPILAPEVAFTQDGVTERLDFGASAFHYEEGSNTLHIFAFLPADGLHGVADMRAAYRRALGMAAVALKSARNPVFLNKNLRPLVDAGVLSGESLDAMLMLGRDFLGRSFEPQEKPRIAVVLLTDEQMEPADYKAVQKMGTETRKFLASALNRFVVAAPALFDIRRLRREHAGEDTSAEGNEVDFRDTDEAGLPLFGAAPPACLSSVAAGDTRTHVCLLSARTLARIYEECGVGLFQRNIRGFLGVKKSKVFNKARDTLNEEPERFLAYNNGVSATARRVVVEDGRIVALEGLQIVNGAQTTGTVAHIRKALGQAGRISDADETLGRAYVLFKVTEVEGSNHTQLVNRITLAANNQNPIPKGALDFTEKRWQFLPPFAAALNHTLALRNGDYDQLQRENDVRVKAGRVVEKADFARAALVAADCPWLAAGASFDTDYAALWETRFPEAATLRPEDDAPPPPGVAAFVEEALLCRMMGFRLNEDLVRAKVMSKSQKKMLLPFMVSVARLWGRANPEWESSLRRLLGGALSPAKMNRAPTELVDGALTEFFIDVMDHQLERSDDFKSLSSLLKSPEAMVPFMSEWLDKKDMPPLQPAMTTAPRKAVRPKKLTPAAAPVPADSPRVPAPMPRADGRPMDEDEAMRFDVEAVPRKVWDEIFLNLANRDREEESEIVRAAADAAENTSRELSLSQVRRAHKLLLEWQAKLRADGLMTA